MTINRWPSRNPVRKHVLRVHTGRWRCALARTGAVLSPRGCNALQGRFLRSLATEHRRAREFESQTPCHTQRDRDSGVRAGVQAARPLVFIDERGGNKLRPGKRKGAA